MSVNVNPIMAAIVEAAEILNTAPEDYFNPRSSVTGELRKTENTHSIHWYSASWMPWHKRLRSAISKPVHFILGRAKGRGR